MDRYIKVEDAISVFEILADKCADDKAFEQTISVLKDILPADVRENAHAHWISASHSRFFKSQIYKCSKCGQFLDFYGVNGGRGDANFCPNCGAAMDEGKDG